LRNPEAALDQHQLTILVAVILAVVVIAVIGFIVARKRRSQRLRDRFGPEYDRVLNKEGEVRRAEGVLEMRAQRREKFKLHPLSAANRSDFAERWRVVQSQFVDDPKGSVSRADQLVIELMASRGYPMADFEQRVADISVDHPVVVQNYRAAHEIAPRHNRGQASTEDMRKAMVHYRSLFEELLTDSLPERKEARA
jgi:FtsZ-interacting cell division protein ZipA